MKPLVAVTRNGRIESIHWGIVCVTDKQGKVIYSIGNPDTAIYFRSSAKPLQVLPLITSGASEALGFSLPEIALACSSHTGQPIHQNIGKQTLKRLGLDEEDLHCGLMRPYDEEEDSRLTVASIKPSAFHCSCSGKHIAMLALAIYKGYSLKDYEQPSNPLQKEILKMVADMSDQDMSNIEMGTDGCGAPIYLLPIRNIALSYARLVAFANEGVGDLSRACRVIVEAMTKYPELVSGSGEFCADIMRVTSGRLVAKVGAESVYCLGVTDKEYGVCVKISDGNERALFPSVLHVLRLLKCIKEDELVELKKWYYTPVYNNHGNQIGSIIPIFDTIYDQETISFGMTINDTIPPFMGEKASKTNLVKYMNH